MGEIVSNDPTLTGIADLEPGWGASRETVGGTWHRYEMCTPSNYWLKSFASLTGTG
ncbi:hypothetical protein D9M71_695780 [compost metagenome]